MNRENERIEQYLKGVVPPEPELEPHRRQLRQRILGQTQPRRTTAARGRTWKMAAVALVLTGAIAAAVGVTIHRYYFEGRDQDGKYLFSTGPQTVYEATHRDADGNAQTVTVTKMTGVSLGPEELNPAGIEETQKELEEIERLRQQDARELVRVIDTEVNGRFHRTCVFRYALANGRTHTVNEGDPDRNEPATPAQIENDQQEIARLRQQGQRDVIKVIDTEVEGQVQRTLICRYVLADGRETRMGEGDPDLAPPTKGLTSEQRQEFWRLIRLNQSESLGSLEEPMYGKIFTFKRSRVTLSDGTVVILADGELKGPKTSPTEVDWAELRRLSQEGAGEALGTCEEQIRGKVFSFERTRYVLSDGTEVIRSTGEPKGDPPVRN